MPCTKLGVILLFALSVFGQDPPGPSGTAQKGCEQLWLSPDSNTPVCMCNATYCDTIPSIQPLPTSQYVSYTSSKAGLRFKKETGSFIKESPENSTITININKKYQTIIGWGGSFTDAAGININNLTNGAKANLLKSYFSEDGLEYNLGRVPIAGSDFSTHHYSYDDGARDVQLKNFKLQEEDFVDKIPLIKDAQALSNKPLWLIGSAWLAPYWMQTNDNTKFGYIQECLYQAWANYHIKFLEAYEKEGVYFWAITPGNEPVYIGWHGHAEKMAIWISRNLGPTLRRSKFSNVKILAFDENRPYLANFLVTVSYRCHVLRLHIFFQ